MIDIQPSKKVYINFPGIQKEDSRARPITEETKPIAVAPEIFAEQKKSAEPVIKYVEPPVTKAVNDKTLYIIGICLMAYC